MRFGDLFEFGPGLREGDVDNTLAQANALQKKLERQGGLARPRIAFDEVEVSLGQTAAEDVVQTDDTGEEALVAGRCHRGGGVSVWK